MMKHTPLRTRPRWIELLMCAVFGITLMSPSIVCAQDKPAKETGEETGEKTGEATSNETDTDDPPATLDDLLGIDEDDEDESAASAAQREQQEALEDELNEESIGDAFQEAIAKMTLSADRLDQSFDPGLGTQRIQEDIIAKLSFLIEKAQQQQESMSSSSSSSSSQQQQQQQQQQDPGQQQRGEQEQQESEESGSQRSDQPGESQEGNPPQRQDEMVNPNMDESRSEWGTLPQRERDMLLQGRQEKFSSLYERLTREYYRRLAEDGSCHHCTLRRTPALNCDEPREERDHAHAHIIPAFVVTTH